MRLGGRNSAAAAASAAASSPRVLDDGRDAVGKAAGRVESTHRPRRGTMLDPDRRSSQLSPMDSGRLERRPGSAANLRSISNLKTNLSRSAHLRLAIGEVRVRRLRRAVWRGSDKRLLSVSGYPPALPDVAGVGWRWPVRQSWGRSCREPGGGPVLAAQERRPLLVESWTGRWRT